MPIGRRAWQWLGIVLSQGKPAYLLHLQKSPWKGRNESKSLCDIWEGEVFGKHPNDSETREASLCEFWVPERSLNRYACKVWGTLAAGNYLKNSKRCQGQMSINTCLVQECISESKYESVSRPMFPLRSTISLLLFGLWIRITHSLTTVNLIEFLGLTTICRAVAALPHQIPGTIPLIFWHQQRYQAPILDTGGSCL